MFALLGRRATKDYNMNKAATNVGIGATLLMVGFTVSCMRR
jgi:hypothetical protein